jgi:hypothetical protein
VHLQKAAIIILKMATLLQFILITTMTQGIALDELLAQITAEFY